VEQNAKLYSFVPDETNTLKQIKIAARVSRPDQFTTQSLEHSVFGLTFAMSSDGELYNELINDFQQLESLLAFSYHLDKIGNIPAKNALRRIPVSAIWGSSCARNPLAIGFESSKKN
jgi:hypothetical protein